MKMTSTPYYIIRTRARKLPLFLYFLLLMPISAWSQPPRSEAPKRELRAVWLTTLNGLDWPTTKATSVTSMEQQKQELCAILDKLKALNINTVLLQTRVRGSVIYPSSIEPWDGALTGTIGRDPGYDPLRFAIEETHRRGMELHAWVVTIPCFKQAVAKQMGPKSVLKTHPELCRRHADMYYLDPGIPGTADYLQRICHEIVSRYDVDGLHFDYIRYPEGASSFADGSTFKRYAPKGMSKASWRRDNITRIVRRIYEDTHALKPWVRVSSSPVGKYADLSRYPSRGWNARDAVHQDAESWLRAGIHDILFPMMYFDGNHFYPFAADWQEQSSGRLVAPGLGIYFLHPREKDWPLSTITRQLHYLRDQGLAGQCYFRSRFLTDNVKGLYDFLHDQYYAFPALPPAAPWLSDHQPDPPTDLQTAVIDDQTEELSWNRCTTVPIGGLRYNVYASEQWPVDVQQAENLIASLLPETHFRYNRFMTTLSHVYLSVTAIDRYGNESVAVQLSSAPKPQKTGRFQMNSQDVIRRPLPTPVRKKLEKNKKKKR